MIAEGPQFVSMYFVAQNFIEVKHVYFSPTIEIDFATTRIPIVFWIIVSEIRMLQKLLIFLHARR